MTLVASGTLWLGAASSGANTGVEIELGESGVAAGTMNDSNFRTLAGVPSGAYSMSAFYAKSNRNIVNLTISANTQNYTLNTAKCGTYAAGTTDVILTINSAIVVGSSSTAAALVVDTSWSAGDTVTIVNGGYIVGKGGNGGSGGTSGTVGSVGGLALQCGRATNITNNSTIGGGGGGGGGNTGTGGAGGGGGGGAGNNSGAGGAAGSSGNTVGSAGTLTGGGNSTDGGIGGALGSAGASSSKTGGAAGNCTSGNSFITWTVAGTRYGTLA